RTLSLKLLHPFRWFFQRIEVSDAAGKPLGAMEKRFTVFHTHFIIENPSGEVLMEVDRPLWTPWTFTFRKQGTEVGQIKKRWSGLLKETFTDGNNFTVHFNASNLTKQDRQLILAAAFFIDINYFEKKARN